MQARHERMLDRWSVVIARYNAKAIRSSVWRDAAIDDWPASPLRDDDLEGVDGGEEGSWS